MENIRNLLLFANGNDDGAILVCQNVHLVHQGLYRMNPWAEASAAEMG
jgi:hypothetical protein